MRDLVVECEDAGVSYSVTGGSGRLVGWKSGASRVFLQVAWSIDELERRRDLLDTDLPVYAGVLVLASAAMARRLGARVPALRPPDQLIDDLEHDGLAGVRHAVGLVAQVAASGAFAGVHLIPGVRSADMASAMATQSTITTAHPMGSPLRRTA